MFARIAGVRKHGAIRRHKVSKGTFGTHIIILVNSMEFSKALKSDILRVLASPRTYLCIMLMSAITFFAFLDKEDFDLPVSAGYYVIYGTHSETYLYNLIMAFLIYGGCFIEDFNSMNIRSQFLRTRPICYTMAKSLCAYIMSVISFIASMLIDCAIISIFKDWFDDGSLYYIPDTEFGFLYKNGQCIAYICIAALEWGLLSGMLTSLCQLLSLYIHDTILCASLTYVLAFFLNWLSIMLNTKETFLTLFAADFHKDHSDYMGIITCIAVSVTVLFLSTVFCWLTIDKRISHE